jgi:hypothetical protein
MFISKFKIPDIKIVEISSVPSGTILQFALPATPETPELFIKAEAVAPPNVQGNIPGVVGLQNGHVGYFMTTYDLGVTYALDVSGLVEILVSDLKVKKQTVMTRVEVGDIIRASNPTGTFTAIVAAGSTIPSSHLGHLVLDAKGFGTFEKGNVDFVLGRPEVVMKAQSVAVHHLGSTP